MTHLRLAALLIGLIVLAGGVTGQDAKKGDPQAPKQKDPPTKAKGVLPSSWGKIGLSDDQKQTVYKIQNKFNDEINKLENKIAELKATRDKEMKGVLTQEQKKRLEDILLGKD